MARRGPSCLIVMVIMIALGGALFGISYLTLAGARAGNHASVRQRVSATLAKLPDYAENKEFYDGLAKKHHQSAMDVNYFTGGRPMRTTFNSAGYARMLINGMRADATAQGRREQADHLEQLYPALVDALADLRR